MSEIYAVGDIVRMKKPHPCGSSEWEILRAGMDFRLRCLGCGHMVLLPRHKFERMASPVKRGESNEHTAAKDIFHRQGTEAAAGEK